jgi:drug/metabolite transporter (DMT)-like permease
MDNKNLAIASNRPLAGIAVRIIAVFSVATMIALVKHAADNGVSIIESVFYRQFFALFILIPIIMLRGGAKTVRTDKFPLHLRRMVVGLTGMIFNFWAVSLLPLAEATTIGFMVPVFATLLAIFLLSERVGLHRWSAIIAGFIGVLIITRPEAEGFSWQGVLVALNGALFTAWVSIIIRDLGRTQDPVTVVFWFTIFSLPLLGTAMIWFGQWHDGYAWLLIFGIGLCGGIAQLALTKSLQLAPVSVVLSVDYSALIWATIYGWLIWSTLPTIWTLIGAPFIIGAGLYIAWREGKLSAKTKTKT